MRNGHSHIAERGLRLALWLMLITITMADAAIIAAIVRSYGSTAGFWLIRKVVSDPLTALLLFEVLAFRCAAFFLAAEVASDPRWRIAAHWLLLVPLFGAPFFLAAMLAIPGDPSTARKTATGVPT